jgi:sterol desaturase/sphingolipid hydroxylase (fatty acid hydroxylase superfamily)
MNLMLAAVPGLLLLLAVEAVAARVRRMSIHRFVDLLTDLGCAAMAQVVGLAVTALTVAAYAATSARLAGAGWPVPTWPSGSPVSWNSALHHPALHAAALAGWGAVFLLVDLGQYLTHRLSHRVAVLWACHSVHHSSTELNLGVALRNSAFHGFFIWVCFLPLAAVGIPWRMVALCYGLNVLYQFLLHTRLVGRLGWFEEVFNTPSHHRVHHGTDPKYLDRNFGGVLIVWDRLWGTFQREEEEPRYGTLEPLQSWNPVWANVHGFALVARGWRQAPTWRGRLRAVFGPPESLPGSGITQSTRLRSRALLAYVGVQLAACVAATILMVMPDAAPAPLRASVGAAVLLTLGVMGGLLDGRRWAGAAETARLALLGGLLLAAIGRAA